MKTACAHDQSLLHFLMMLFFATIGSFVTILVFCYNSLLQFWSFQPVETNLSGFYTKIYCSFFNYSAQEKNDTLHLPINSGSK